MLAGAILYRMLHSATVLNFQGRSYRSKEMEATLGGANHHAESLAEGPQ